jgi:DNA-binding transcriptional LysR family regulator
MKNWDDYRLILALARAKTLRGTATALGINHSTVSRRLTSLNANAATPVFEPVRGGYQPTSFGQTLVDAAEQIEMINLSSERIRRAQEQTLSGRITLSVPTAMGQYLLLDELAQFCGLYPHIDLQIYASYQFANLDKSEADIVVRGTDHPPDHLVGRRLFSYAVSYYCHKDYLEQTPAQDRRWIGRPGDGDNPDWIQRSPYPDIPVGLQLADIDTRHAAAVNGLGLTRGACFMADPDPRLVRLAGAKPNPFQDIWVLTHPDLKNTPRIKALMQLIAATLTAKRDLLEGRADT